MRSFTLAAALGVAVVQWQVAEGAAKVARYVNARFGYAIDYPADRLSPQPEADNGDGRAFHPVRGTGRLLVWGAYRDKASQATPAAIVHLDESDCAPGKITYEAIKPRFVAFSCIGRSGAIIYQKTLVGRDVIRSVRFDYPDLERTAWEPIVKQVSASLHATSE